DSYAGAPPRSGALAHYSCRVHSSHRAGDGEVLLGYVVRAGAESGPPLFSYAGDLVAGALHPARTTKETSAS
ncbi:flavin reductase, partial [Streptomyces sp. NPDC005904]